MVNDTTLSVLLAVTVLAALALAILGTSPTHDDKTLAQRHHRYLVGAGIACVLALACVVAGTWAAPFA